MTNVTSAKTLVHQHRLQISGTGPLTVILGNGFGTDQFFWRAIVPWLERRYRVVRFDWSLAPSRMGGHTIDGFADDLLAIIAALGAAPAIVIGHSMAGMIGMLAAQRMPAAICHIVMLSSAPCYVSNAGYVAGFERQTVENLLYRMTVDFESWVNDFASSVIGDRHNHAAIADFTRTLRAMPPDVACTLARHIFLMDLRNRLDGFSHPTTIIQPTDDPAVPLEIGQYLAARWPQARLEMIEASGHFPHLTAPDMVLDVLARALPELSALPVRGYAS